MEFDKNQKKFKENEQIDENKTRWSRLMVKFGNFKEMVFFLYFCVLRRLLFSNFFGAKKKNNDFESADGLCLFTFEEI